MSCLHTAAAVLAANPMSTCRLKLVMHSGSEHDACLVLRRSFVDHTGTDKSQLRSVKHANSHVASCNAELKTRSAGLRTLALVLIELCCHTCSAALSLSRRTSLSLARSWLSLLLLLTCRLSTSACLSPACAAYPYQSQEHSCIAMICSLQAALALQCKR